LLSSPMAQASDAKSNSNRHDSWDGGIFKLA
jgi:hypothetical protein